jgi:hypothetical protein
MGVTVRKEQEARGPAQPQGRCHTIDDYSVAIQGILEEKVIIQSLIKKLFTDL